MAAPTFFLTYYTHGPTTEASDRGMATVTDGDDDPSWVVPNAAASPATPYDDQEAPQMPTAAVAQTSVSVSAHDARADLPLHRCSPDFGSIVAL